MARTLSALLVVLATSLSMAADRPVRWISIENGLGAATAYGLHQDRRGFIYIGTPRGLDRFDGLKIRHLELRDEFGEGLETDDVSALIGGLDDTIWIATWGAGVARFDPRQELIVERLRSDATAGRAISEDRVQALLATRGGELWVGTYRGLDRVRSDGRIEGFRHDPSDSSSLGDDQIWALAEDPSGGILVGTTAGLSRFDPQTSSFELLLGVEVRALAVGDGGLIWIGTDQGIVDFDVETGESRRIASVGGGQFELINTLTLDSNGTLWIGDQLGGVARVDGRMGQLRRLQIIPDKAGIEGGIKQLLVDATGMVWIATQGSGVGRMSSLQSPFELLAARHKISAVVEDRSGQVWLGSVDRGLLEVDPGSGKVQQVDANEGLRSKRLRAIAEHSDGSLWLASVEGLDRFHPQRGIEASFGHDPDDPASLSDPVVEALLVDSRQRLWIGTDGGLDVLIDGRINRIGRSFGDDSGLSGQSIIALAEDPSGSILIGTETIGLIALDPEAGSVRRWRHVPGDPATLEADRAGALFRGDGELLWIGSHRGLDRLDLATSQVEHYLPGRYVSSIVADRLGRLWLGTHLGLVRFDPSSAVAVEFGSADGVGGSFFHRGAATVDASGRLLLGGNFGVDRFDPVGVTIESSPPSLVISEITVLGRQVSDTRIDQGVLHLDHREPVLSVELAALHFADPESNRYAYRLDGFEADWLEVGADRRALTYTNLPPGSYELIARAANGDGVWGPNEHLLKIEVKPAPWRSIPAYFAYFILIVGASSMVWRRRLGNLRSELELLQERRSRERELERKSKELRTMVELGRVLAGVADAGIVARRLGLLLADQLEIDDWAVLGLREGRNPLIEESGFSQIARTLEESPELGGELVRQWGRELQEHQMSVPRSLWPEALDELVANLAVRTVVPILSGSTLAGLALLGERRDGESLDEGSLEIASGLASQAAVGLEAKWKAEEAERWRKESEARRLWERLDRFARLVFVAIGRLGFERSLAEGEIQSHLAGQLTEVDLGSGMAKRVSEAIDRLIDLEAVGRSEDGQLRIVAPALLALPEAGKPVAELARETLVRVGAYRLEERIGVGGMGEVYRAINVLDGKAAAVKIIYPHAQDDPALRQRFEREGAIVASIDSPHIVRFLERGEHDGRLYLAMELIEGQSLSQCLKLQGSLGFPETLKALIALSTALATLHQRSVVHRDVTPSNFMQRSDGSWVLLDLGLATGEDSITLTDAGAIIGTIPYLAPERLRGDRGDARADVWAVGVLGFEMLTAALPWSRAGRFDLVSEILEGCSPTPEELTRLAGPELGAILARCLKRDLCERYDDARDLAEHLRSVENLDAQATHRMPEISESDEDDKTIV